MSERTRRLHHRRHYFDFEVFIHYGSFRRAFIVHMPMIENRTMEQRIVIVEWDAPGIKCWRKISDVYGGISLYFVDQDEHEV